jgi:hypothetical protein
MAVFEFQVVLSGVDTMTDEIADALFTAGCDDATPYSAEGIAAVGFSREAATLEEAARSAIADVNRAGFVVARIEPADQSVYLKINQELTRS